MNRSKEFISVLVLALIMGIRMLGLFMILPVFSMHAGSFQHATPELIGIALGVYGLTQAVLQMPFGMLSDRIGRRPVMSMGLALFIAGSICAALTHNIYGLILGRALQGGGAIGSTILAMISDLTREENRSKAMAGVGMAVGGAFLIAMAAGPIVNSWFGLSGIFWITAVLATIAELLVWRLVPSSMKTPVVKKPAGILKILRDKSLMRLNISILLLHAILTAFFIAIPLLLTKNLHLGPGQQTVFYILVMVLSFIFVLPLIVIAEKKQQLKEMSVAAIAIMLLSQWLLLNFQTQFATVEWGLLVFFAAFSFLEAILPSWVSKIAPLTQKGTAMGLYSSSQFLGIFLGGTIGGLIYAHYGLNGIFELIAVVAFIWMILAYYLPSPPNLTTVVFNLEQFNENNLDHLTNLLYGIAGVAEVAIIKTQNLIYLKIDSSILNKTQLRQSLENSKLFGVHSPQGGK